MTPLFTRSSPWAARTLLLTGLLCLPLTGAVMYGLFEHQRLELETSQVQQQLAQRQQVLRKLREVEQRRLRQAQQLQAVPPAIKLLDNIGSVLTPDIALLSIDVIASKGDARLTVNAGNLDALLAFSERLQQLPAHVVLENHRQSAQGDPAWPINAVLDVKVTTEAHHAASE
ncbi:hypothetical protein L8P91_17660 [Enterobacter bugandensis]|jgi:hypothetical protein|uniref:Fimbrial protein n=1 Tax=Enterobacter bugandensis TaxID=881260 RepID=A0ABX4VHC3_9ENTR|nr:MULTISPECIES: hypothetical protein [Enterobacter]MBE3465595.1 hypothetical protein [Enterobacter cloacae complex sp. P20C]MBE3473887.1 hypothetical protein [Enterobacter cloacae complex sp. P20B]MBE3494027.1 hypothetical protein [Enterobacter cloacae complex sp. P17RS]MBE3508339.1 hypothetical protein [Enterobacter cloacae complex sp. I10]MBE3526203.1 hypothetical protein [Enterobacter cloacae complex sp. I9]